MKTPKFLNKLSAIIAARPKAKLRATARAARPAIDDYDAEEPTTKLSSAFIVVLILHVVAVGGIYAFNSIKASRRDRETIAKAVAAPAPAAAPAKPAPTTGPAAVTSTRKAEPAAPAPAPAVAVNKPAGSRQYEVKSGDNLTKISFAYKVSATEIRIANQLKEDALLRPGQMLVIPAAKPAKVAADAKAVKVTDIPATKTTPGLYVVKKGDTFTSIAKSTGASVDELAKANKTIDPKKLQPGQVLKVPPRKS